MEKLKAPAVIPRTTIRLNVAVQVLAAFVLLVAVNYFSFNHYARKDFSRSQKFVLTDQTRRVLRELEKPVQMTVFVSQTQITPDTLVVNDVNNLLKELAFSARDKLKIEVIDPMRNVTRARELQSKYKFSADENVIILDYDGRVRFVPMADMADFDLSGLAQGEAPTLLAFKGEQTLTNALIALVRPEKLKAYFLQGHGEPGVGTNSPLGTFIDYIQRQNVLVAPVSLTSADHLPTDCATLAIVAPQGDIDEREAAILTQFWQDKGRLLVLLDPAVRTPRLDTLLQRAGIAPRDNRVLKIVRNPLLGNFTGIWRVATGEFMPQSTVTKRLAGMTIVLPGATQSLDLELKQPKTSDVQVSPLIVAAEEYWGESEYVTNETKGVRYDEGRDVGYPVYLAASTIRGGVSDDRVDVESAKIVVVGNCEFALDAAPITPVALDFLMSSMNWLLDRGQLTGSVPKKIEHFTMNLSEPQIRSITLYTMVLMPGAAAVLGLIAWLRRRA